jgi:signal transduction histidine kinase
MTQLELSANLAETLQSCAQQSGQSVEEWLTDLLTRHSAQQEMRRWSERLITHDLRSPLAAIMTSAEMLQIYHDRLTDARRLEHLRTIQMQVRTLNNLLDNVMVIQKAEARTLNFAPQRQDLVSLCEAAIQDAADMIIRQPVVTFQVEGAPQPVLFDERLLRLALVNVLINAIRFSPDDAGVQMAVVFSPSVVSIMIRDQGAGIPPDEIPRVFELFYRGSNIQSVNGKGLGLYVVRHIVNLHQGRVYLESQLNSGTQVTLELPTA